MWVQVVQWVPQNDLLAHKDVLAFLTHGGVNGLYEVNPCLARSSHSTCCLLTTRPFLTHAL